ncbi:hypothetical protein ACGVWS_00935 [Enterobacteriaceae bacterium LUAb1]
MLTRNYALRQQITTVYRLDFRPPSVILTQGIKGSNNVWINSVFGENTIFTSKSLRGISRFFLESVMNKHVDGSGNTGLLKSSRQHYPADKPCYIYKINIRLLDYIDVAKDLANVLFKSESSHLYHYAKTIPVSASQYKDTEEDIDDHDFEIARRLNIYNKSIVTHTEEVIVRGPVHPSRISFYQQL